MLVDCLVIVFSPFLHLFHKFIFFKKTKIFFFSCLPFFTFSSFVSFSRTDGRDRRSIVSWVSVLEVRTIVFFLGPCFLELFRVHGSCYKIRNDSSSFSLFLFSCFLFEFSCILFCFLIYDQRGDVSLFYRHSSSQTDLGAVG